MGKQNRTSLATMPWDMGPITLAILGDVPEVVRHFRQDLRLDADLRASVNRVVSAPKKSADPKEQAKLKRAEARAREAIVRWMRRHGYQPAIEPVTITDPETGRRTNPNGVKRARRICWYERYQRLGKLTPRQSKAAEALSLAWERTQRSAPAIKAVNVDTSPKPDANVAILVDRIGGYHAIARHVSRASRAYIDHVVLANRSIRSMPGCTGGRAEARYLARLAEGLDDLADMLRL
ncbi:MAG: hypothetical protein ABNH26_08670 [Celeribacter sp.]|jgi:hypothetical protein